MGKRILHLTLKRKWFDLIASGEKGYELREDKPYWRARLCNHDGTLKDFDEIHATNGYGPAMPFLRVEFMVPHLLPIDEARQFAAHGEDVNSDQFVICLGRVLEVRR